MKLQLMILVLRAFGLRMTHVLDMENYLTVILEGNRYLVSIDYKTH
jgi:hypothetical protein